MAPPRTVGSWAEMRHSTPSTTPMPDDRRGPHGVLGAPGGQGGELEEGGVPVDQQLDPLAGQQLAPLVVAGDVSLATTGPGRSQLLVDPVDRLFRASRLARNVSEAGSMVEVRMGMSAVRSPAARTGATGPVALLPADVGRIGP